MTRSTQTILGALGGALLIILLVLAAISGGLLTRPAQAQPAGVTGMRHVTVVGNGEVQGRPDTAHVQIGVETSAATTQEALAQNNAQVAALIARLQELGVAENDIQTSGFNIYPTYTENGREVTGYTVSNTVAVTIRDLAATGELLDQVVEVGANRVYGISFSVADPSELMAQARTAALADAQARAGQLAQGVNATVGQVLIITENIGAAPPMPMPAMERAQGAGAVPVQPGEQTFNAQVQVTFELR